MSRRAGRALPWAAGAALLLAATGVTAATPPSANLFDPFPVSAADGGVATGRTITASIVDLARTERVSEADGDWQAEGNWLVVELAASATVSEVDAAIGVASLLIDGRLYQASERPPATLVGADLRVGTDTVGMLAFELPAELDSGTAELRLSGRYPTPELDDVLAFRIELADAATADTVEIDELRLGSP